MADVRATVAEAVLAENAIGAVRDGWKAASACRGLPSEVFVAEGTMSRLEELAAKAVCARCVVIDACLAFAIAHGSQFGVWGGMTAAERRPLVRAWRRTVAS